MRRLSLLVVFLLTLVGLVPAAQAAPEGPGSLPKSMAAAGDSITRGYDVTVWGCVLVDCPAYSWATGTSSSVQSHYARIRAARPGTQVAAANVARTGARVNDLDRQLQRVAQDVQYVTVLIGANDVCTSSLQTMTPTDAFRTSADTALRNFFGNHQDAYLFLSSIPNVYQLWSLFKDHAAARSVWQNAGICQSMLSSTIDEATRQQVLAQEVRYNEVLAQVCAAYARCRWDGGATFGVAFTRADVSTVDYFHPSVAGQAKLASVTWAASYWPSR